MLHKIYGIRPGAKWVDVYKIDKFWGAMFIIHFKHANY